MARVRALLKRAIALQESGKLADAAGLLEQICRHDASNWHAHELLGQVLLKLGRPTDAIDPFMSVLRVNTHSVLSLTGLAQAYLELHQYGEAERYCRAAITAHPDFVEAHNIMGNIYREQSQFDAAEKCYMNVVSRQPNHIMANYYLGNIFKTQGRTKEAIDSYGRVVQLNPGIVEAYWNRLRILPVIYDNEGQIHESRENYRNGVRELHRRLELDNVKKRQQALRGLFSSTNFYLQYQGMDDLDLQKRYGEIIVEVMSAAFPQWSLPLKKRLRNTGEKIRIGYCSAYLRDHNGANWLAGWLRARNHDDFEVFCYHIGMKTDDITREFMRLSDHFTHLPGNLVKVCENIVLDELDILVYPELGMDPQSMMMAGLRLAPVQCVGWGHPITSGLATMDYWLSSDLMEPVNGQDHYLEKLVRLPNLANNYSRSQMDRLSGNKWNKTRRDFGLPDDAVLYFSSQSLYKYLPQYDDIWPKIATQVPRAKFVFLAISSVHLVRRFMRRIDDSFRRCGIDASDYCVMLNRQSSDNYLSLNLLMDVFLDNPPWSGNNTSLASIDCGVPIVTWPTKLMRGRHSYAILKMMGIMDTIAESKEEYVDIAVRLGNEASLLNDIKKYILSEREKIYEDTSVVSGLENFYRNVCHGKV